METFDAVGGSGLERFSMVVGAFHELLPHVKNKQRSQKDSLQNLQIVPRHTQRHECDAADDEQVPVVMCKTEDLLLEEKPAILGRLEA